jgi:lipoprotein-releasing system permease protein
VAFVYKYLLCWRYLKTRYIALASVISVMLGVATMIVVNSVMAGFSDKMRDRLHGVLADVVVESYSLDGFYNSDEVIARIASVAGDEIEAMAATMETFGLLKFRVGSESFTRQVQVIGVRPLERAKTGEFADFLMTGRTVRDPKTGALVEEKLSPPSFAVPEALRLNSPAGSMLKDLGGEDKAFEKAIREQMNEQVPDQGAILGWALGTVHVGGRDQFLAPPGTKISLIFPKAGNRPEAAYDDYSVVGYFKSGMSEYDSTHVYIPLERLQFMRLLQDKRGGAVNAIQIKVKPGVDIDEVSAKVQTALEKLRPMFFRVRTWEKVQGPLLAAVAIEQSILNMLLFFIIAVAGFGILAIFSMIVVEKTRDIGILKALGASTSGVRGIFLGYGLLLGMVGSGVGMAGGLLFVAYINEIEKVLSKVLGHKVFDDSIYYFNEIPTLVSPWTVAWIVGGALFIAAAASVWPAQRAARLHPVRALRFE